MVRVPSGIATEAEAAGLNCLYRSSDEKKYLERGETPHINGDGGQSFGEKGTRAMPPKPLGEDSLTADWEIILPEESEDGFVLIENCFPQ